MAVTRLKRKGRRNRVVSKLRQQRIKNLTAVPVLENVDVEAIKAEFEANKAKEAKPKAKKKAEKVEEAPAAEASTENTEEKEA